MIRIVFILMVFLCSNSLLFAQSKINEAIKAMKNDPVLAQAGLGVCVLDVATGKKIAEHRSDFSLTPASSMKVITTAAALSVLGSDYHFKTNLEYDGTINAEGTLAGNLYIKGFGDPTLASTEFEAADDLVSVMQQFQKAIEKAGIRRIEGKIIGDASWLGTQGGGRTWAYEDLGNYYGAGAMGLNFHENLYYLTFQQNPKLGGQPKVKKVEPHIPNLMLINELTSDVKGSGDNAYIFGSPYTYTCFVRGSIPLGSKEFTIKGAIPDPTFSAAHTLMQWLEKNGIPTSKHASTQLELELEGLSSTKRTIIYTHQSPDLKTIVQRTNMKSVNLYCEAMLRVMGKEKKGEGTAEAGLTVLREFWKNKGLNMDGLFLEDGSGLSPYNAMSVYHLAEVIRLIKKDANLYDDFYESLPLAGKSGALKNRLKGTDADGKLRAKSGGLNRVRSYTGLVKNKKGQWISFSIIANNYKGSSGPVLRHMMRIMEAVSY